MFLPGARSSGSRRLGGLCVVVAVVLVFVAEGLSWVRWASVWPSAGIPVEMVLATGADKWNRAAREALDAWNHAGSNFRFTSTTSSADERGSCSAAGVDRRNVVVFASAVCGDSWSSTTAAITRVWYSTADNLTVDADVFFNAERDWDVYEGPVQDEAVDFRRVALHEFGHVLGLNHPDDEGQSVDAIMNSHVDDLDTLQADDEDGVRALYGPSATVRPDLVVLGAAVDESVATPGQPLRITATVENKGSTRSPVTTLEYLSRPRGGTWAVFEVDVVNALPPSGTSAESVRFSAPSEPGAYEYRVCVESVDREQDATNNCSLRLPLEVQVACVVEPLGPADREHRVAASWEGACISPRAAADDARARYYSFSVQGAPRVRVGLSSREPASLYLLRGEAVDGGLVTFASGADPRIVRTLSSGTYTVEVLPARAGVTAAFVLRVGAREPFVDDPLQAGDPIRAAHLTELRERIDALRGTAGLGPFRWTDPTIVPGVTPIRAVHVTELHTALNEVYLEDGRSRPARPGDVREGVPIAADHFNAIRRAIEDL